MFVHFDKDVRETGYLAFVVKDAAFVELIRSSQGWASNYVQTGALVRSTPGTPVPQDVLDITGLGDAYTIFYGDHWVPGGNATASVGTLNNSGHQKFIKESAANGNAEKGWGTPFLLDA